MKSFGLVICASIISGCALHRNALMVPDVKSAQWADSSCGYFDNALNFGQENSATIRESDLHIEFCSSHYYSKLVGGGIIIPLFPIFGREPYTSSIRWARLTNLASNGVISIQSDFFGNPDDLDTVLFNTNRYPGDKNVTLVGFSSLEIELAGGQHVWIGLPDTNRYTMTIHTQTRKYGITMKAARSWSWFMPMH